jgi:hypothetical protein
MHACGPTCMQGSRLATRVWPPILGRRRKLLQHVAGAHPVQEHPVHLPQGVQQQAGVLACGRIVQDVRRAHPHDAAQQAHPACWDSPCTRNIDGWRGRVHTVIVSAEGGTCTNPRAQLTLPGRHGPPPRPVLRMLPARRSWPAAWGSSALLRAARMQGSVGLPGITGACPVPQAGRHGGGRSWV